MIMIDDPPGPPGPGVFIIYVGVITAIPGNMPGVLLRENLSRE